MNPDATMSEKRTGSSAKDTRPDFIEAGVWRITSWDIVIGSMAIAGRRIGFRPVHLQKLIYRVSEKMWEFGNFFEFKPRQYGYFDKRVYNILEAMAEIGRVEIQRKNGKNNKFVLTKKGLLIGKETLECFTNDVRKMIKDEFDWVISKDFPDLLESMHSEYPDSKTNSIYKPRYSPSESI